MQTYDERGNTPALLPDPLYPDAGRPPRLAAELCGFFARLPEVRRIILFGSQARGTWDRWSDLDLLLVTAGEVSDRRILAALRAARPVIHHAALRRSTEHPGRHVLGIVFEAESVFHSLDLNFMPLAAYRQAGAQAWFSTFGPALDRYVAPDTDELAPAPTIVPADPPPDPREQALAGANWWLKRAVRHTLRTGQGYADLAARAQAVQGALAGLPDRCAFPGGDPCRLARVYLSFAARLLARGQGSGVRGQ